MSAHLAAAKHLDSAEYQLLKLFDEFPMLAASRERRETQGRALQFWRPPPVPAHAMAA